MQPESSPQIVDGPQPTDHGDARFVVEIGTRRVEVFLDIHGCGVREQDSDVSAPSMNAVWDYQRANQDVVDACLRDAAHLRRATGNDPMFLVAVPDYVCVVGDPAIGEGRAVFTVSVHTKTFEVWVTPRGRLGDSCVEELAVAPEDLWATYRAVLHHVLQDPPRAKAWGLDPDLLELFWT